MVCIELIKPCRCRTTHPGNVLHPRDPAVRGAPAAHSARRAAKYSRTPRPQRGTDVTSREGARALRRELGWLAFPQRHGTRSSEKRAEAAAFRRAADGVLPVTRLGPSGGSPSLGEPESPPRRLVTPPRDRCTTLQSPLRAEGPLPGRDGPAGIRRTAACSARGLRPPHDGG